MKIHSIGKIEFGNSYMKIVVDEKEYKIDLKNQSKKLSEATDKIRMNDNV